ncbi:hypothetical protein Dda_8046 [Drechslerella dactyloides]|uniref:Uncharacterized protein n=1 Tax=Drechslerella dactyloides TaxID=74499 RepID=A0AAD6IT59_DREDA|nr:hypothetical protein Dda_8046 [Drechslerella dactyloides]
MQKEPSRLDKKGRNQLVKATDVTLCNMQIESHQPVFSRACGEGFYHLCQEPITELKPKEADVELARV